MKNWSTLNISKKIMIENLKISLFEKNINNIHLYTCDFICNNNAILLLETLIEIYIEYYNINNIEINNLINNCITNIKNNNKHIYLCDDRMLFNTLSNSIIFLNKINSKYYKKNYEVALQLDSKIILNNLDNINLEIWENIKPYLPYDQHKYFLELIYYISSKNINSVFNLLNTIINKFSRKTKLLISIETIDNNFKDHLIILLLELFKYYKNHINSEKLEKYYEIYSNIFYWKLKKGNIQKRSSIIFILFELILSRNVIDKGKLNVIINYDEINNVYSQLIEYYELDKVIKTPKKKEAKKKSVNKSEEKEQKEENMDYLFTIVNYNNKSLRNKQNKVERNNYRLNRESNNYKPITIDGNDSILENEVKNNIKIIKNY